MDVQKELDRIQDETRQAVEALEADKRTLAEMHDSDHATAKAFDLMGRTFTTFNPSRG